MNPRPTRAAIDHFAAKHARYWTRLEALDVLRETRTAARDLAHFMHITGLTYQDAYTIWVSGRDHREAVA